MLMPNDVGTPTTTAAMMAHTQMANRFNNTNRNGHHRSRGNYDWKRGGRRGGNWHGKRNASGWNQGRNKEHGYGRSDGPADVGEVQPPKQKAKNEVQEDGNDTIHGKKSTYF